MPELNFQIIGVESATRGLVPLMHFKLEVRTANPAESVQGLLLNAQIQIQSPQRAYNASEKERVVDLFGTPERWGQTLRNRLWTHANCTVGAFTGVAGTIIPVPCTFDLNVAATKYFYALDDGEVPLLFLFSGSAFYLSAEGALQVERISWNKECTYRMPVQKWKDLMEEHYPNCAWLYLKRDIFERLYDYRRRNGIATWEQTIEALLDEREEKGKIELESDQREGGACMNPARLEEIVDAVLYEGYILYPYRATSKKNCRERFTFGRVYPESYSIAQNGAEHCVMQTECLLTADDEGVVTVCVRFLQPMLREIGELVEPMPEWNGLEPKFRLVPELRIENQLFQTWHEAVEHRIEIPPQSVDGKSDDGACVNVPFTFSATRHLQPILKANGEVVGVVIRSQPAIDGLVEVSTKRLEERVFKVTVRILNQTGMTESELFDPEALLERIFASTHTILSVESGEFISSMDPGEEFKSAARNCKNIGTWPVLVGDEDKGERSTMLSSPIILYDYPKIAPESAGNLFDGTEIDEILSLRLQTLTEDEKFQMRHVDEHARRLLERTDALQNDALLKLHGMMRSAENDGAVEFDDFFGASTRLESVTIAGVQLKAGDRVRIRPKSRADVMDVALAGQIGIIEAVEQDLEKRVHLALVLECDPGKDLGMMRQPGHRFFYGVDEIEPLAEELT